MFFRTVIVPTKDKPKKCPGELFGCSKCRRAIQEWKRQESLRKNLGSPPSNNFVRFSILGMALNIGFTGLMMAQGQNDAAFKGCCGALAWAACIFIFDRNHKHGI